MKTITLKIIASGIVQYYDFNADDNNNIVGKLLPIHLAYQKYENIPDISKAKNVDDVINIINTKFITKLYLINGLPLYCDEDVIKTLYAEGELFRSVINKKIYDMFLTYIKPIMNKNNWKITKSWCGYPVLGKIDDNDNFLNIDACDDMTLIDILSEYILSSVGVIDENSINFKSQIGYINIKNGFSRLMYYIGDFEP